MGQLSGALPFGAAVELLQELTGVRVGAKTAQTVAKQLGGQVLEVHHQQGEELFTGQEEVEAQAAPGRLYVAIDGTSVPTDEGWKEAKVAAIYQAKDNTQAGPTSYVSGYWSAEECGQQVYVEALKRGAQQAQELVVLGDGAVWIWNLAAPHFPGAVQILDWYHVKRRIWEVGQALYGEGSNQAAPWVAAKLEKLWAGRVAAVVADLGRLRPKGRQTRKLVREARVYLANNQQRLCYPQFRARGYHIGSGVVASACKHLIAQRQKLAGMRWSLRGAAAILALRTLLVNRRWRRFWSSHSPP